MLTCRKCLNNNFDWKKDLDGNSIATCNQCGQNIIFEKKEKLEWKEGDKCRDCKTPVIIKESKFKESKLKKPYYYTAYYYCSKCKKIYLSDKFKIMTGVLADLPDINCETNNH